MDIVQQLTDLEVALAANVVGLPDGERAAALEETRLVRVLVESELVTTGLIDLAEAHAAALIGWLKGVCGGY